MEEETEKERPLHLPLALLPRRTEALGTAVRWRRKPEAMAVFAKSKLELGAIGTCPCAATISCPCFFPETP